MIEAISKRQSVRNFKSDKVSDEIIEELILAAQAAPSALGSYPLEYVIVKDKPTKDSLFDLLGQDFLKAAPVLIIPVADLKKTPEPVADISVATENIMLQATEFGLGTVWKNVNRAKMDEVIKILSVPNNHHITNIIPLGFPNESIGERKKPELKIHLDKW